MSWRTQYVTYRLGDNAKLYEVYETDDFKAAKYWLTYIALPGDVCCRTPLHPKSAGTTRAEYWSHKEQSGSSSSERAKWDEFAKAKNFNFEFPESQNAVNENCATAG